MPLSPAQRDEILRLINQGKPLPPGYLALLSDRPGGEWELCYPGKRSESEILAPPSPENTAEWTTDMVYSSGSGDESIVNRVYYGDNLHWLQSVYHQKGLPRSVKGQVRLIYIDPPFGTGEAYGGNRGQNAYSAKLQGPAFIEFLRQRLILAREILAPDGIIAVRNAYNFGHYVKVILDEIFGIDHFVNEIIIKRKRKSIGSRKKYEVANEYLYIYARSDDYFFENQLALKPLSKIKWTSFLSPQERRPKERTVLGLTFTPPEGQHFSLKQSKVDRLVREHYIRLKHKATGTVFYYSESGHDDEFYKLISTKGKNAFKYHDITAATEVYGVKQVADIEAFAQEPPEAFKIEYLTREEEKITNDWTDIPSYTDTSGYPTENSEALLTRLIRSFTQEGDLVVDFFAGSGSTGLTAEKLNRRWEMVDMGKFSRLIMLQRLLQIDRSPAPGQARKPYGQGPRPFAWYVEQPSTALHLPPVETFKAFVSGILTLKQGSGTYPDGTFLLDGEPVVIYDYARYGTGKQAVTAFLEDLAAQWPEDAAAEWIHVVVPAVLWSLPTTVYRHRGQKFRLITIPQWMLQRSGEQAGADTFGLSGRQWTEQLAFRFNRPPKAHVIWEETGKALTLRLADFRSCENGPAAEQRSFESFGALIADTDYQGGAMHIRQWAFANDLFSGPKKKRKLTARNLVIPDEVRRHGLLWHWKKKDLGRQVMIRLFDIHGNMYSEIYTLQK